MQDNLNSIDERLSALDKIRKSTAKYMKYIDSLDGRTKDYTTYMEEVTFNEILKAVYGDDVLAHIEYRKFLSNK